MQSFEKNEKIAEHIIYMAVTGKTGNTIQWTDFLSELNSVFDQLTAAESKLAELEKQELKESVEQVCAPSGHNRYGLDANYFSNKMQLILRDIDNYKPDEMARSLARLVLVADENVLHESEFTTKPQCITEQDARELLASYSAYAGADAEMFIDAWLNTHEGRALLAKLNEHREPEVKPFAWAFEKSACRAPDDCEDYLEIIELEKVNKDELEKYLKHGRAFPLYCEVIANKAEVQNGQDCFIGSRNVGKFVGLNPHSGSYVTVSDSNEYRAFHGWQLGLASLPPLKDE